MGWREENARWRETHWRWTEECWDEGIAFLQTQRKLLPKDAEVEPTLWLGKNADGVETAWICLRWRVPGSPWQDTEGFNMSTNCPPFCG